MGAKTFNSLGGVISDHKDKKQIIEGHRARKKKGGKKTEKKRGTRVQKKKGILCP